MEDESDNKETIRIFSVKFTYFFKVANSGPCKKQINRVIDVWIHGKKFGILPQIWIWMFSFLDKCLLLLRTGTAVVLLKLIFSYHTGYNFISLTVCLNEIEVCVCICLLLFFNTLVSSIWLSRYWLLSIWRLRNRLAYIEILACSDISEI